MTSEFVDWNWKKVGISCSQVFLSFLCFRFSQFIVRWYLFGTCTFKTFSYFGWGKNNNHSNTLVDVHSSQPLLIAPPNRRWRISNEAVSLGHSVVSGFWALYAIIVYPKLIEDMVNYTNTMAHYLLIVSTGYLIHDLTDLVINEQSLRIIELLFHHIVVLIAFGTNYATNKFLGVVICGLLMELNSIFLHSRSMLNLYRVDKSSTPFRIIALLNIVTFIVFRMAVSTYLLYWQITTAWKMVWYLILVTFVVIVSLAVTNIVLLYRVLAADGLLGKRRQRGIPANPPQIVVQTAGTSDDRLHDEDEIEFGKDCWRRNIE
uniref:TLC domain-containing protein n=1 Tax=Elaeophora elaphi TaxID=1147741 RepID=A0A0R3RL29_9BILA